MTTFKFALSLFNLFGIILMTAIASTSKDGIEKAISIFATVCFTISLVLSLTAIYVGS